jgi:predicted ATPase
MQAELWPKFVHRIEIDGLRGWSGQLVHLKFPVVAVVGENGTGKTTLLKALACCYEADVKSDTYYPSDFFQDTPWDRVEGVTIKYFLKQGDTTQTYRISKRTSRWNFGNNRPKRKVIYQDISRTLPLDATAGYARIAKMGTTETDSENISDENLTYLSHVLGRPYESARFATSDVSQHSVGVFKRSFGEFSQYHQGAGEDATLDLFRILETIPATSLLIIDEVEASLHPKAQRRLIDFLMKLSRKKRCQIVVSTHSPYVLEQLPQEARILLVPGNQETNVIYGASVEFAMSRMDDPVHPEMVVYVEDREAEIWLREILVSDESKASVIDRIEICPVGPANVVQTMGILGAEGRLPNSKSLAILDGDKQASRGCIVLPGTSAPEIVVYGELKDINWANLPERIGVGAGTLFADLEDIMTDPNHHNWNKKLGDKVRKSHVSVWETLVGEWARMCLTEDDKERIYSSVEGILAQDH